MPLSPGARLGPYEILAPLGAGGATVLPALALQAMMSPPAHPYVGGGPFRAYQGGLP